MNTVKPEDMGLDSARLTRITTWLDGYVHARKYAGASVLIARGGQEVYYGQSGLRSVEDDLPFTRDTMVRLYSMTKPVTSVALMMLTERGLFNLDTPLSDFIPAFGDMQALVPGATRLDQTQAAPSPSLHQLLTHTSGLSYPFNPGILSHAMNEVDLLFKPDQGILEDQVDVLSKFPLAFQPGSRWEYSVGIDVIGRVVEIASGQTLGAFFRSEIFEPLGMDETAFAVPKHIGDRFAALYTPLAGDAMGLNDANRGSETLRMVDRAGHSPFESATLQSGGGGLVGTIDDYMKFAEFLRGGGRAGDRHLLSPKTLDFMMRNHLPGDIASMGPQSFAEQPMEGMGFGLGGAVVLDPARARAPGSVGDFSWGGMASTFFWVDRALDLSVVFFTQLSPSSSYPARSELKALVHGAVID